MRALGRSPVYSVILTLRMTWSKGRRTIEDPDDIKDVTIEGGASMVVREGRSVGEVNGDTGVVGEGTNNNGDSEEHEGDALCEDRKAGSVFKVGIPLAVILVSCFVFSLGVSVLSWDIVSVSISSTRFGKARWVILVWPSSHVNSSVVSVADMVVQRNVIFFRPNAL